MGSDSSICNEHILIRVLSQGTTLQIYFSDAVKNLKWNQKANYHSNI